jgi:hypothetical protein
MMTLQPDRLAEEATQATGLDDLGPDTWQEGLDRLVAALRDEAELNDLGREIVGPEIVDYLSNRLCIIDWARSHPEVARGDVVPPIIIVGQARTGTTILYDLLAQDPDTRVPLTWEVDKPCPPPETATYESDPRADEVDETLSGVELVLPGFQAMHPMGARLAQECVRMTASDFRSLIFATQYRVPSYTGWLLDEADLGPAYRWHRQYLQHLQSRHPGLRWLLKSPAHLWHLGALMHEYPGAQLVQTHRDPVRIIASIASLQTKLRSLAADDPQLPEIAREWSDYILDGLDRSVDAREDGTVPDTQIVDVQFAEFMADPFATVSTIYDHFGIELTESAEAAMGSFYADHSGESLGKHSYRFADTGLDEGELRERARRYQEYFDVPSEDVV